MNMIESIQKFCSSYKSVACYGMGFNAVLLSSVLKMKGIEFSAYIVSDKKGNLEEYDGKPVIEIAKIKEKLYNFAVVVSVASKHHNDIKNTLNQIGIDEEDFFFPKELDEYLVDKLRTDRAVNTDFVVNWILHNKVARRKECGMAEFDHSSEEINIEGISKYEKIEIRMFYSNFYGNPLKVYTYVLNELDAKLDTHRKVYYLYVPVASFTAEKLFESSYKLNPMIAKKLKGENSSVLTQKNLLIWKRILLERRKDITGISADFFHEYLKKWISSNYRTRRMLDFPNRKTYVLDTEDEREGTRVASSRLHLSQPYVCVFARDSAFVREEKTVVGKSVDLADAYRNSNIKNFKKTAAYLDSKGIQTIRMGRIQSNEKELDPIIDYPHICPSELMDFYLCSKCMFYIGTCSGAMCVPELFKKPMGIVDYPVIIFRGDITLLASPERDLMLYQKLFDAKKNRFLTAREIMDIEIYVQENHPGDYGTSLIFSYYQRNEIVPVKNTQEEILDLTKEMLERIQGRVSYTEEDDYLQARYADLVRERMPKWDDVNTLTARVGKSFLRKNKWFLK